MTEDRGPKISTIQNGVNFSDFLIYCIDISSRMDRDIPVQESDLQQLRAKIRVATSLSNELREKLLDLITPPISYFHVILVLMTAILLQNIRKFEKFGKSSLQSLQIIILSEVSEEIFRFPDFSIKMDPEIILNFLSIVELKRREYLNSGILEYRNYKNLILQIFDKATYVPFQNHLH